MSFDPTGRYKGSSFDPNYVAKKKAKQQNQQNQPYYNNNNKGYNNNNSSNHHYHQQQPQFQPQDSGWNSRSGGGGGGRDGGEGGGGGGYSSMSHGPSPPRSQARFDPDYNDRYTNNHKSSSNRHHHDPPPRQSPGRHHHQRSDSRNMDDDHRMGHQQSSFSYPKDHGYGARPYRDHDNHGHGGMNGQDNSFFVPQQLSNTVHSDSVSSGPPPPDMPSTLFTTRTHTKGASIDSLPHLSEPSSATSYASVTASLPTPTDHTRLFSSLPPLSPIVSATITKSPITASPAGGELNSLEKLKLFKAQVEASRARKASQGAASVTRVAESFLLAQAESREEDTVVKTSNSPVVMMPPPPPMQQAASEGSEEGEIPDSAAMPREQLLKLKLRQKLAKAKGGATPTGSAPMEAPLLSPETSMSAPVMATPSMPIPSPKKTTKKLNKKDSPRKLTPKRAGSLSPHSKRAVLGREEAHLAAADRDQPPERYETRQQPQQQRGRSSSPPRRRDSHHHTSPPGRPAPPLRREASPPPRREASPPPRRQSSDSRSYDRRSSMAERRVSSDYPVRRDSDPATPSAVAPPVPATALLTPSGEWVLKQMELLKAQMHELEKLVPSALAVKSEPAVAVPAPAPPAKRLPSEYETPTRSQREERPRERSPPTPYSPKQQRKERGPAHEPRSSFVPKHGGKPYDRPPPDEFHNAYGGDTTYGPPRPWEKPTYDKYDNKPFEKRDTPWKKGYKQRYDDGGSDHGGYQKGGYHDDNKKPYYKKYHKYNYDNEGGGYSRGGGPSGRGGYKHQGGRGSYNNNNGDRRPHQRDLNTNPNYKGTNFDPNYVHRDRGGGHGY